MTTQHTPGPWTYESDHTHRQYNIRMLGHLIGTRDEAKHICTVNNLPPHVLANRDPATAEANAHLIAAAPELLAASRILLAIVEHLRAHPGDTLDEHHCDEIDAARAAIAKAEGRS